MNFEYSEEQSMLDETVSRLLTESGSGHQGNRDGEVWHAFAELGLLGMVFDEEDGGIGAGPVETMIVMRAIGRSLCTAPFLASAVHATALLKEMSAQHVHDTLTADLIAGTAQVSVAHSEPGTLLRPHYVELRAEPHPGGFSLTGRKTLVLGGGSATHFFVSARTAGEPDDPRGISLFLIPASAPGLTSRTRLTIDGRTVSDLIFNGAIVAGHDLLGAGEQASTALEKANDIATVASLNEAVGALEELLAVTVDYLKTRRQFGSAIGTFQALQHKAVDMFVEVEQAKSMALYAVMQLDLETADRRAGIGLAKVHINRIARQVGETAVQLHGAIGMTLECKAGRLFNRLVACQILFGDTESWMASLLETAPDILAA